MFPMLGHNGLALGGGDLVGHIGTGHLGDGVAVLNLDGDGLDLGVVNAVLGGDLTAGVLHGGLQRVSNSVGGHGGGGVGGVVVGSSQELGVSLGLGISLPLGDVVSGSVTDHINDLLADLLVLDLLSLDSLGGADVLGGGGAGLGDQGLHHGLAVGGGVVGHGGHGGGTEEVLRVGLSISSWGGQTGGNQTGDGKYLHHFEFEIVRYFPRWQ